MDVMTIFIILYSMIALMGLLLVFIFMKTPAMPFLKASLLKCPIIYLVGKDSIGHFKTFKRRYGGAHVKKEGIYALTENSHTLEGKTKIPIYFAFRDFAATQKLEYPCIIQELREKGYKITDVDDVLNLMKNIKAGIEDEISIDVKPYKTYKIHELQNMFPFNLDPTFIDAQVQGELNKFSKLMKAAPMALMSIVILLIVGAIAVFILQKAFKGSMSPEDCQAMVQAAKCSATNVAQVFNSTPIG